MQAPLGSKPVAGAPSPSCVASVRKPTSNGAVQSANVPHKNQIMHFKRKRGKFVYFKAGNFIIFYTTQLIPDISFILTYQLHNSR